MNSRIDVMLDFGSGARRVGELFLLEKRGRHVFAYDRKFLSTGLQISPLTMPLGPGTFEAPKERDLYDLHGVFADSLPDEWGRRVQDAEFEKAGIVDPTSLTRLSYVGRFGIGALQYEPALHFSEGHDAVALATLRKATLRLLEGTVESVSRQLLQSGGSAGGARPKFLVDMNELTGEIRYTRGVADMPFRPVLLKVPQRGDDQWQRLEHLYCQLARACGITVPDTWLLTASDSSLVHFAIARFDITADGARYHTHTLAGLKGESYTQARYDYRDILRITADLTRDARDVGEMYRRMVFNYLANNRDDHAKNFSFIMNAKGVWHVSPAYDLGFSPGETGLHASSANGKRRNLELRDFAAIAEDFDIRGYREIVRRTSEVLQAFESLSLDAGVSKKKSALIAERIRENLHRVKNS